MIRLCPEPNMLLADPVDFDEDTVSDLRMCFSENVLGMYADRRAYLAGRRADEDPSEEKPAAEELEVFHQLGSIQYCNVDPKADWLVVSELLFPCVVTLTPKFSQESF